MAQLGKNLPAIQGTWAQPLGWEDPLEKGMTTYSSIWPRKFRGQYSPRVAKSQMQQLSFTKHITYEELHKVYTLLLDLQSINHYVSKQVFITIHSRRFR